MDLHLSSREHLDNYYTISSILAPGIVYFGLILPRFLVANYEGCLRSAFIPDVEVVPML